MGAAATKSGRFRTAGWAGPGERDGKVYARNRCCYASLYLASSNPVDAGWWAVRTRCLGGFGAVGNSRLGLLHSVREAVVKVYGVAMARPQG